MNQTGVRSVGSRRAARTRRGSVMAAVGYPGDAASRRASRPRRTARGSLARLRAARLPRGRGGRGGGPDPERRHRHVALPRRPRREALLPLARRPRQRARVGRAARRLPRPGRTRRRARGRRRAGSGLAAAARGRAGRYRLAFDLVEEHRFWFAEVGSAPLELEVDVAPRIAERRLRVVVRGGEDAETAAALAAQEEPLLAEDAVATAHLVAGAVPAPDWSRRLLDAHAEGYAAVGGSIEARDRALRPWAPGGGRDRKSVV